VTQDNQRDYSKTITNLLDALQSVTTTMIAGNVSLFKASRVKKRQCTTSTGCNCLSECLNINSNAEKGSQLDWRGLLVSSKGQGWNV